MFSQTDHEPPAEIRTIYLRAFGLTNPAGLAYSTQFDQLFVLEKHDTSTEVSVLTPYEDLVSQIALDISITDPINATLDDPGRRLLVLNSDLITLTEVAVNETGNLDPGRQTQHDVGYLGLNRAAGMAVDPDRNALFILDGATQEVLRVTMNAGQFDGPVTRWDLAPLNSSEMRGLAVNPVDGHLLVLAPLDRQLHELNAAGEHVQTYNLAHLNLSDPQGLVIAPSADLTDSATQRHLYLIDRDPVNQMVQGLTTPAQQPSGKLIEIALAPKKSVIPATNSIPLTLVRTIQMSAFNPPSPDTAGVGYISTIGRLLASDSEVNEMPIFTGNNLFEVNISGSLQRTGSTLAYSDEPTGVGFNPANGHIFISDDTGSRAVYEVAPGPDGLYGSADDLLIATIGTSAFGSKDPEGVTYDAINGFIFIADGVNNEIYRVDPVDNLFGNGNDSVTGCDTLSIGIEDPEGIHHDANSGNLFVVGKPNTLIHEITPICSLVQTYDISTAGARKPAGLTIAPGSVAGTSIYVVDRGVDNDSDPNENDGKMYELQFDSGPTLTPQPTFTPSITPPPSITFTPTVTPSPSPTLTPTATATLPPGCIGSIQTTTIRVSASTDDAEESNNSGSVKLTSSDLELITDGSTLQTVGIRFPGIPIASPATILEAYIEFETDQVNTELTNLVFAGENTDNPAPFTDIPNHISARPRTNTRITWNNVPPWNTVSEKHQTPDLAPIVQEIVDRSGWASGNALAFIITGSGVRTAEAFDGEPTAAPLLFVRYCPSTPSTLTPTATPTHTPTATTTPTPSVTPTSSAMQPCDADYNNNKTIDAGDLILQSQAWRARSGDPGSGYDLLFDPIRDEVIRVNDLMWVAQHFGLDCSSP